MRGEDHQHDEYPDEIRGEAEEIRGHADEQ
jgi:hypothetical protein